MSDFKDVLRLYESDKTTEEIKKELRVNDVFLKDMIDDAQGIDPEAYKKIRLFQKKEKLKEVDKHINTEILDKIAIGLTKEKAIPFVYAALENNITLVDIKKMFQKANLTISSHTERYAPYDFYKKLNQDAMDAIDDDELYAFLDKYSLAYVTHICGRELRILKYIKIRRMKEIANMLLKYEQLNITPTKVDLSNELGLNHITIGKIMLSSEFNEFVIENYSKQDQMIIFKKNKLGPNQKKFNDDNAKSPVYGNDMLRRIENNPNLWLGLFLKYKLNIIEVLDLLELDDKDYNYVIFALERNNKGFSDIAISFNLNALNSITENKSGAKNVLEMYKAYMNTPNKDEVIDSLFALEDDFYKLDKHKHTKEMSLEEIKTILTFRLRHAYSLVDTCEFFENISPSTFRKRLKELQKEYPEDKEFIELCNQDQVLNAYLQKLNRNIYRQPQIVGRGK